MRDRSISIRLSRSSAILETQGIPRGRFRKHQIPIGRMTTDGTRRSSVESSGAHDHHQETNRTAGVLSRRNHDQRTIRDAICGSLTIEARSPYNLSPIAARSCPRFRLFHFQFNAKIGRSRREIEAMILPKGIAPTTPSNRIHDCLNCLRSSG